MQAVKDKPQVAERAPPELRERPQPIGYRTNDWEITAPLDMQPEDLLNPQCWAMAKYLTAQDHAQSRTLQAGDAVRVRHRDWFATCIVDRCEAVGACHVLVERVTKRGQYAATLHDLVPSTHYVELDALRGVYLAGFYRSDKGGTQEKVPLGDYRVFDDAAAACRDHANRTRPS